MIEKLMAGVKIKGMVSYGASSAFCDFFMLVKKGHDECGDSAFVYCDENKLAAGVFDGVSGEEGAAAASSAAIGGALSSLKVQKRADECIMQGAVVAANSKIENGFTTAAMLFIEKNGSFVLGGVGDSPAYGINSKGETSLELPLGRPVGDGHSILKFLSLRSLVTSVLGPSAGDISLSVRRGRLKKGEMLILASDGLSDNLYFVTNEGYVSDSAGTRDLAKIISKTRNPEIVVKTLAKEIAGRIKKGKIEKPGAMLVPKTDDLAIIAIRFNGK